jgi:hypothetical protein
MLYGFRRAIMALEQIDDSFEEPSNEISSKYFQQEPKISLKLRSE